MSNHDQCPSTKGTQAVAEAARPVQRTGGASGGQAYWRSIDEFSGTSEFKEFVEREFPAGASELTGESRRTFLKVMGAGLALAGAATIPGCRRPERKIMPYSAEVPEEIIPGKALYYATATAIPGGGAEGLLVETHEGRPTHIEGNPLHPVNRGKTSVFSKAGVLGLYDPDRLKGPTLRANGGQASASWDDFASRPETGLLALRSRHSADGGAGLAFVVEKKTSPTRDRMKAAVMERYPRATWVAWNPAEMRGPIEGTRMAFGRPMRVHHKLSGAQVVLSLDADFLDDGPSSLVDAREFGATRVVHHQGDEMSRLYVAESRPTSTGSNADHRFSMAPSRIAAFAVAVARALGDKTGNAQLAAAIGGVDISGATDPHMALAPMVADDLIAHRGHAVIIPGKGMPAAVHALAHAMNAALGAMGSLVQLTPMSDEVASDSGADLAQLTERMASGAVRTLVCIGTNPVYDAPAGVDFAGAWAKVPHTITLSVGQNETEAASEWSLNGQHELESWSDVEAWDGTLSVVQPMIAPLYEPAKSDIELLAMIAGIEFQDGYELVTDTWGEKLGFGTGEQRFEKVWRRALHDGMLAGSGASPASGGVRGGAIASAVGALNFAGSPTKDALEVTFRTGRVGDGRYANNAWLQELPDLGSGVVWDNPVLLSPKTATELGLLPNGADEGNGYNPYTTGQMPKARRATLSLNGRSVEVAAWILPGMPDNVAAVTLGYGRTACGKVGDEVGDNTYAVRPASAGWATGATLTDAGSSQTIASTQNHWSMESRTSIVRAMDKQWYDQYATKRVDDPDLIYGTDRRNDALNVAEKLGELSHTPDNLSSYENPQNKSRADVDKDAKVYRDALKRETPPDFARGPQWGMTIDLNSCTGCGVCTVACQSENNIPVVGKSEVAKGREMTWIRVDRYFTGEDVSTPDDVLVQPVACVHCENAPCEVVCPVNATVHGPEGTNNMAYNRCIGTRYCANNCPYKVRRFNFFDWAQSSFRGGLDPKYVTKGVADEFAEGPGKDRTFNQNFIPPRLRAKLEEIRKMQMNPDVTVRSRGVMEKCSYCIQRVNAARHEVKVRDIWTDENQVGPIPDGFFQTACQQACPTSAITFGDILDPESQVSRTRDSARGYLLLGYLDTRPRTSYLMRVRNPNESVLRAHWAALGRSEEEIEHRLADPLAHHGGGHGGDHEGGHGGEHHDDGDHGGDGEHHGAAYFNRFKQDDDRGYAMSLRILGGAQA